jgi:hypothetical protein
MEYHGMDLVHFTPLLKWFFLMTLYLGVMAHGFFFFKIKFFLFQIFEMP